MGADWTDGWDLRLLHRVGQMGYGTLQDFARARPAATYAELAAEIGSEIAPVQVEQILQSYAEAGRCFSEFARESLVRYLNELKPKGWVKAEKRDFSQIHTLSSWLASLSEDYEDAANEVWNRLEALDPDEGWLPSGPSDILIMSAFKEIDFDP